jgi:hypothetical protein
MKFRRWLAPLSVLALSSASSRPLHAQAIVDVVLRVHVRVANFDAALLDSAAVFCTAAPVSLPTNSVASEDTKFTLTRGAYEGNIDVKLRLTPSHFGEQWLYQCRLKALSEIWGWGVAGTLPWLQAQVGSQSVVLSEGFLQAY